MDYMGHEYFSKVSQDFIEDGFNLTEWYDAILERGNGNGIGC